MVTFGTSGQWEYDPASPLGKPGAFGAVFRGRSKDGSEVAVKMVSPTDELSRDRLRTREVDILRRTNEIGSTRLIRMLDVAVGSADELLIVLELADGQLDIDPGGAPVDVALAALEQIIAGLIDLHGAGIIHRDLKPANVLRIGQGLVLSDFGIARDAALGTQSLTFKGWGTPAYMAPELWRGGSPTVATDLYAIGIVAYELLTGQRPFNGDACTIEGTARPPDATTTPRPRTCQASHDRDTIASEGPHRPLP